MNNNLLHENQFGFQINDATEHTILQLHAILPKTLKMASLN